MSLPRRLGPRSLTARLVLWVCVLVVVLVVLIGTATYFALKSFLSDQLDRQLKNAVSSATQLYGHEPVGPAAERVWAVELAPSSGEVLNYPRGESIVALHLSGAQRQNLATRSSTAPLTMTTTDGTQLRLTIRFGHLVELGTPPALLIIGLSTSDEQRTLSRVVVIELVIGVVAVVVAMIATTAAVRFSLRGLRRVSTTAQEVAAELSPDGAGLDRRVPMTDEATEVGQLAESMNTLLGAVEAQFAARLESEHRMRRFLADASHELRTPLTSIRGYAELARMQRATGADAEDNLDRIESEGTRMSRLVDDLLVLARGDSAARPVEPELVDLEGLLDDAARSAQAAFPQRAIGVEAHPMSPVLGDRDQLLRVVRNLVTNAAVHTQPDRPIRILGGPNGSGVTIQVVDGGPGLPPEEAAHVFERFWRADKARSRARGGSGLGLSIVYSIVRSHGGSVAAGVRAYSGTFRVITPRCRPALST
jgi:two-component system OmpR family sensor kinase